jgi:hypothetical protein
MQILSVIFSQRATFFVIRDCADVKTVSSDLANQRLWRGPVALQRLVILCAAPLVRAAFGSVPVL